MQEYETHQLASDSDDEKRIIKAEARAAKKVKEEKAKKQSHRGGRFNPYRGGRDTAAAQAIPTATNAVPRGSRRPGNCYRCGEAGHWQRECGNTLTNKLSSCTVCYLVHKNRCIKGKNIGNVKSVDDNIVDLQTQSSKSSPGEWPLGATHDCITGMNERLPGLSLNKDHTKVEKGNISNCIISPVNRLKEHIHKWEEFGASEFVLSILRGGYRIPFKSKPQNAVLKNNRSALDNPGIVREEIEKLLKKGCVTEVCNPPSVVNPLTVAFNKVGKPRLVLDCRHINPLIHDFKFRMEDVATARELFNPDDFLFGFDLKSAYHHIGIYEKHRDYLGFQWNDDGKTKFYVFNVLPFGVSVAAYIFTKITRVLISKWRSQGLRIVMYLDDGLCGDKGYNRTKDVSIQVKSDLEQLGFLLADEKCQWEPVRSITWLGYNWNLDSHEIKVTNDRITKVCTALQVLLNKHNHGINIIPVKELASVAGRIISMEAGIGQITRFRTRSMYDCILSRNSWKSKVKLTQEVVNELKFWLGHIVDLNGRTLGTQRTSVYTKVVYSDASEMGFGAYIDTEKGTEVIGTWTEQESVRSSTWRELEAVNRSIDLLKVKLSGHCVKLCTDNKNVKIILEIGNRKPYLHCIALDIREKCNELGIRLEPFWVSRTCNTKADYLSKSCDSDDWGINKECFKKLDKAWGPYSIDRFASDYN